MTQLQKVKPPPVSTMNNKVREDGYHWPINEIVMESHVMGGESDADIARTYHVMREEVTALRRIYGL